MRLASVLFAASLLCGAGEAAAVTVISTLDLREGASLPPLPPPNVVTAENVIWAGRVGPSPDYNFNSAWQFRNFHIPPNATALTYDCDIFAKEPNLGGTLVSIIRDGGLVTSSSISTTSIETYQIDVAALAGEVVDLELRFGSPYFFGPSDIWATVSNVQLIGHEVPLGDYNGNGRVEQGDLDLVLTNWGAAPLHPTSDWTNGLPEERVAQDQLDLVLLNWGLATAASGPAIPEPGGWLLAVLCGACAAQYAGRLKNRTISGGSRSH
jgi:hypothetical protein